jgi:hypothetical protein
MGSLRSSKSAFLGVGSLVVYQKIGPLASSKTPYPRKRQTSWKRPWSILIGSETYGKKYAILGFTKQPQDVAVHL